MVLISVVVLKKTNRYRIEMYLMLLLLLTTGQKWLMFSVSNDTLGEDRKSLFSRYHGMGRSDGSEFKRCRTIASWDDLHTLIELVDWQEQKPSSFVDAILLIRLCSQHQSKLHYDRKGHALKQLSAPVRTLWTSPAYSMTLVTSCDSMFATLFFNHDSVSTNQSVRTFSRTYFAYIQYPSILISSEHYHTL